MGETTLQMAYGGFLSKEAALTQDVRQEGLPICFGCGRQVERPVIKRRRERTYYGVGESYGVYHYGCKARRDA